MKCKQFSLKLSLLLLSCIAICFEAQAQEANLKLHYAFDDVSGKTVPDKSGSGCDAQMVNSASVIKMGKCNVLSLGAGEGYLDMTAKAGAVLSKTTNFTISVYYRVDKSVDLSVHGNFLWVFSTLPTCWASNGVYTSYRLNAQHFAASLGGFEGERSLEKGKESIKGEWMHVLYRQTAKVGRLYVNGELVDTHTDVPLPSAMYKDEAPAYNWLGRPNFGGDAYLKNTLIADFKLYNVAVSNAKIAELAAKVEELNYEYMYGSQAGDFSSLIRYIEQYNNSLAAINPSDYPPLAITEFKAALAKAQDMVDGQQAVQSAINDCRTALTAAYQSFARSRNVVFNPSTRSEYNPVKGFKHPGAIHTQEDFDRIKRLLEEGYEPVVKGYERLRTNTVVKPTAQSVGTEIIMRGGGYGDNYGAAMWGAAEAYQNALLWKISGNRTNADNAVTILNNWARVCKKVTGNTNSALASGIYGHEFANAAELMRDYDGWKPEDFKSFQKWMLDVWYPHIISFQRTKWGQWAAGRPGHYWANWGLCNTLALMSIGVLCDDVFIYNQALSFYKYDQCGKFDDTRNPARDDMLAEFIGHLVPHVYEDPNGPLGYLGQMQESGRDMGHSLMCVGLAGDVCQVGWSQGDDLFALMNDRLIAGIEYVAYVNSIPDVNEITQEQEREYVYFHPYLKYDGALHTRNGGGRGGNRPIWGRFVGYYEGVRGVKLNYVHLWSDEIDGGGGQYGGNSGGFDHLGYTTLTGTRPLITPDQAPTQIIPTLFYDGETLKQNELGGLVNTYNDNHKTAAVPPGSLIKLIPTLPDGVTDTGNWTWESGETTKDLEITADNSGVYRVAYINEKGVKSEQVYTIAVQGDCQPEKVVPFITLNGAEVSDTIITVLAGSSLRLAIESFNYDTGWGAILWNNGAKTAAIEVMSIYSSQIYTAVYTNQCGRETKVNFHINVLNNKSIRKGNYYIKDVVTGKFLVNDGSDVPNFVDENDLTEASRIWTISKDGSRYKIISGLDNRFLKSGKFTADTYDGMRDTYILFGEEDENLYSIQNSSIEGAKYWTVNPDGTINGGGSSVLESYPFEIIPVGATGIDQIINGGISIYPNPVRDHLIIDLTQDNTSYTQFMLWSVDGRILKTISCQPGEKNIIQMSELVNGLYFGVLLNEEGKKQTIKIIKE